MRTILTACLLLPATAFAGPVLDTRVDASSSGDQPMGAGFGARIGYDLDLGLVRLIPEGGLTLWTGSHLLAPDLGVRAAFGSGIEPGVYAHVLFPLPTPDGPTRGYDAGARLDLTALPKIDLGLHLGWTSLYGPALDPQTPFVAGLHVTIPL